MPDTDRLLLADPHPCGVGRGADCCAFLLVGSQGFECGRVTGLAPYLRARAIGGQMNARRLPDEPYPDCRRADWTREEVTA